MLNKFIYRGRYSLAPMLLSLFLTPAALAGNLTLGEVVAQALQRHPEAGVSQSRQAVAQRQLARSESLLAGDAALQLRYKNDSLGSDNGLDEWGAGVELPIWLPGQKETHRSLADSINSEAQAAQQQLAWQVAGEVRERAWSLRLAQSDRDQAQEQLRLAQALEHEVDRRRAAGELADADWVLARQETLVRQDLLREAQTKVESAENAWKAYTGLSQLPEPLREQPAEPANLPTTHPKLRHAHSQVERSRAERERVRGERRANPLLSVGVNHERGDAAADYDDSLELSLSIPFGSSTQAAPLLAEAEAELTKGEAALAQAQRELAQDQQQAKLELQQTAEAIQLAEERMTLATRGEQMAKRAFELGESDLVTLLRARNLAAEATLTLEHRRIEHQRAIARYNQIFGALPQ